jgi:hypothetical protein
MVVGKSAQIFVSSVPPWFNYSLIAIDLKAVIPVLPTNWIGRYHMQARL